MLNNLPKTLALLLLPLSLATGCGSELDAELDAELSAELSETDQIIANLLEFGYSEADIEITEDGRVVVQGDMIVGLEASREMIADDDDEGFRQYRTAGVVSTNGLRTVTVIGYTGPTDGIDAAMQSALVAVVAEYNRLELDIRLSLSFANSTNADIIVYRSGAGTGGNALTPSGGNPGREIRILTGTSSLGQTVLRHVIKHEIGHTLGLHHSDFYNKSISCGQGASADPYPGNHIPGTPTTASFNGSVMNACFHNGSKGYFSLGDHAALQQLYGSTLAPSNGWCIHNGAQVHRADLDGDGRIDLLCHDTNDGHKWIDYAHNGINGTDWELVTSWCSHVNASMHVGDFDGDGRGDWLCTDTNGSRWIDYASNGFGNAGAYWQSNWCTHGGAVFTVADLDNDGRDDVACRNGDWSYAWYDYAKNGFNQTDWHGQGN